MGQYIYTIVAASIFCAVTVALSPDGEKGKLGKFVAFIGALAITVTMLSPLPSFFQKEVQFSDSDQVQSGENEKNSAEYYATSAGMALCEIYGTEISDIKAEVTCTDSGEIAKIELFVNSSVYYSTEEAGEVLSEIYGMEIEVREER